MCARDRIYEARRCSFPSREWRWRRDRLLARFLPLQNNPRVRNPRLGFWRARVPAFIRHRGRCKCVFRRFLEDHFRRYIWEEVHWKTRLVRHPWLTKLWFFYLLVRRPFSMCCGVELIAVSPMNIGDHNFCYEWNLPLVSFLQCIGLL